MVCWGTRSTGSGHDVTLVSLSAGAAHACGLRPDGSVLCWGSDRFGASSPPFGERYAPSEAPTPMPAVPPLNETFTALALSYGHSCALAGDGKEYCWGDNDVGQASPPTGEKFSSIDTSQGHSCGLRKSDGLAVCWGSDYGWRASPPPDQPFTAIGVGQTHVCALRPDGTAECWGNDIYDEGLHRHRRTNVSQLSAVEMATVAVCAQTVRSRAGAKSPCMALTRVRRARRSLQSASALSRPAVCTSTNRSFAGATRPNRVVLRGAD